MGPHKRLLEESLARFATVPAVGGSPGLAAVLVPVVWNPATQREEILLTKRTDTVQSHKGQISFPGGMWEPADNDLLATALRETHEEIGLPPSEIQVVGRLEQVITRGALPILPWVGYLEGPRELVPNREEVQRVLYLPLETLIREGLRELEVPVGPVKVTSIGIWLEEELVWGATARILHQLRAALLT